MTQPFHSPSIWLEGVKGLGQSLRSCHGIVPMCWAVAMAWDVLMSPTLYRNFAAWTGLELSLRVGPTLLGWLYLAPLLWTQCSRSITRPSGVLPMADAFSSPRQAAWSALWWSGPLIWALALLPVLAWALFPSYGLYAAIAWGILGIAWLLLAVSPAAADAGPGADGISWALRWRTGLLALGGIAAAFIVSNLIVGVALLPALKSAGDSDKALGVLLIALSNLGVTLVIWTTAVAGAVGWSAERTARRQKEYISRKNDHYTE